jgi:glutaredoxin 3
MITIYSTPTCGFCHQAKAYFKSEGIDFTDIDVSQDYNAAMHMVEISGQMGVPVIDIDGDITVGFYKPAIEAKLREKKILS